MIERYLGEEAFGIRGFFYVNKTLLVTTSQILSKPLKITMRYNLLHKQ